MSEYNLESASSGEYHFISTIIGILSKIKENSLILIDEPENSFHPNWQIRYIEYLKRIFNEYKTCHFIVATHSHFMISDLRPESSTIVTLERDKEFKIIPNLLSEITFGLSAEEILYNIFKLPTVRNYYVADEIGDILNLMDKRDPDLTPRIKRKIEELNKIERYLKDIDPLKLIIKKLNKKYE